MDLKGANSGEFKEMEEHADHFESIRRAYIMKNTYFTFYSQSS